MNVRDHKASSHYVIYFLILKLWLLPSNCHGDDSYERIDTLMDAKLGPGTYNIDLRPLNNQSSPLNIEISFSLMSVVQIDDVQQRFTLNGFVTLTWTDQRVTWNPWDFGGVDYLQPQPKNIWRPRMLLLNTLGDRDLFKDNYSPLFVNYNGSVVWMPGGLFKGACALNMQKYPFDEQWCYIRMCPMSYYNNKITFKTSGEDFDLSFFSPNEGWDLTKTAVKIVQVSTERSNSFYACPNFSFKLKRRPMFFIFNIILPVIVLSVLNTMVFIIPTESGEKIGYGITVLLALSVFLTTVSTMVPKVSDNIPVVAVYLFVLLIYSSLTVLASMVIVYLHHAEEREETISETKANKKDTFKNLLGFKRTQTSVKPNMVNERGQVVSSSSAPITDDSVSSLGETHVNKYKVLSKHINKVGFATSITLLAIVNIVFMIYLRS